MQLTITGYSTALFSTWYFIEELGLLFDAGDGVTSTLLQKSRKIDNVFISHADRDHLTGLLQLNQLNARDGFPKVFFPANANSLYALETFSKQFDGQVKKTIWQGLTDNEHIEIRKNTFVQSVRNNHVPTTPDQVKSLGYQVYETKAKLKAEYVDLPQPVLMRLITELGREALTEQVRTNVLAYSGDTPVENFEMWNNTKILIHEATFLAHDDMDTLNTHRNKHSSLEDVLNMVSDLSIDTLILGHFSSRYSSAEIDERLKRLCGQLKIRIPVYRVLPGRLHRNILAEDPIN